MTSSFNATRLGFVPTATSPFSFISPFLPFFSSLRAKLRLNPICLPFSLYICLSTLPLPSFSLVPSLPGEWQAHKCSNDSGGSVSLTAIAVVTGVGSAWSLPLLSQPNPSHTVTYPERQTGDKSSTTTCCIFCPTALTITNSAHQALWQLFTKELLLLIFFNIRKACSMMDGGWSYGEIGSVSLNPWHQIILHLILIM